MHAVAFRALGEPSRLRIVETLRTGPFSVGDLADALGIRQPQVSKHLRVLADAGLVTGEVRARHRIYHLRRDRFGEIADWVDSFEPMWEARLDSLGDHLSSTDPERTDP